MIDKMYVVNESAVPYICPQFTSPRLRVWVERLGWSWRGGGVVPVVVEGVEKAFPCIQVIAFRFAI